MPAASCDSAGMRTPHSAWEVFRVFLRLGLTLFGGPVAHLAFFRDEFVRRRQWLTEEAYFELLALCQFLPGPASSQMGIAIGHRRAGWRGAVAAWVAFTTPSALLMAALGLALAGGFQHAQAWPWVQEAIHALKLVTCAVVMHAVWSMAKVFCPSGRERLVATLSWLALCLWTSPWAPVAVMAVAAAAAWVMARRPWAGWTRFSSGDMPAHGPAPSGQPFAEEAPTASHARHPEASAQGQAGSRRWAVACLALLPLGWMGLPVLAAQLGTPWAMLDSLFRSGSMVVGGGHTVLPLLQADFVGWGWVTADLFLAGYGLAQLMPGPLFTVAAFLGAVSSSGPGGWTGAGLALLALFLPAWLWLFGAWPFWWRLRAHEGVRLALAGVNASVVGLLASVWLMAIAPSALRAPMDGVLVGAGLWAWARWRWPSWAVVLALLAGHGLVVALRG